MINILHDNDADAAVLSGKTIAIIGYGNQGSAQALCLRDSGVKVIIGETEEIGGKKNPSWEKAKEAGFDVFDVAAAASKADIVHMLLPDEHHGHIYKDHIEKHMTKGKALSCSHGFNIVFKQIVPPADVDVIMVAPKSPATEERKAYLEGFGVPGLVAVRQDASGKARDIALAIFGVKEEYLEAAFDEVDKQYGSIENYFSEGLGLNTEDQQALRAVLLARNTCIDSRHAGPPVQPSMHCP